MSKKLKRRKKAIKINGIHHMLKNNTTIYKEYELLKNNNTLL